MRSSKPTVFVSLTGQFRRESDKAVLIAITREEGKPSDLIWFPKSQLSSINKDEKDNVTMMVAEWLLKEKNLLAVASAQKEAEFKKNFPSLANNDDIPF